MFNAKKTVAALALSSAALIGATSANAATQTFSWTSADLPFAQTATFTVAAGYKAELSLASYSGAPGSQRTGYFLTDGTTRFTTAVNNPGCAVAGGDFVGGCALIEGSALDGTVLFSDLGAGSYTLGVYENASPAAGTLAFDVTVSPIPLPAGGLLLIGALGGVAALRKRRKAA